MTQPPWNDARTTRLSRLLTVGALAALAACNTADLSVPGAGADAAASCATDPVVYCEAGAPGDPGCAAEPDASSAIPRALPAASRYPVGCVVSRLGVQETECAVRESCRCAASDAGAAWACDPAR